MTKTTRIGVDVGGTFTDLALHDEARGLTHVGKLLTTPDEPSRAIIDGIARLLAETGTTISQVGDIIHGTTLITNTVLERTGARTGLLTTEGFRDILEMAREVRYDVDDLHARPAPVIVPRHRRHGVPGRITADGTEHAPLDAKGVRKAVETLLTDQGIEALAIAFLHSYANPAHELQARDFVHRIAPGLPVTLSCEVAPELGEYERTSTACLNAYVQPAVHGYLGRLERDLAGLGFTGQLSLMLSSGGLTTVEQAAAFPVRLLESGPAAGVIAAAFLAGRANEPRVIAFDMGGTTAKTCLIEDGRPLLKHEFEAGHVDKFKPGSGLPLRLTVIDLIEIGAGGGSIAAADDLGLLKVGPRSAGSVPGPVAYGRGGQQPTVTDADLLAGYLDAPRFLGGEMPLALSKAADAIAELGARLGVGQEAAAAGIHDLVTENMAAAARMHLAGKGRDPRDYTLLAFGGAGPVHAYALARRLKVRRVIVPQAAGVLSALGFLVAAPRADEVRSYPSALTAVDWDRVAFLYADMEAQARQVLHGLDEQGSAADFDDLSFSRSADMRYLGQGFEITVPLPDGELSAAREAEIRDTFHRTYQQAFGRTLGGGTPELTNWRLSATRPAAEPALAHHGQGGAHPRRGTRLVRFPGFGALGTAIYDRSALPPGWTGHGPALFEERETSCAVGPDCRVAVDTLHNLIIDIDYGMGEVTPR
jgi:N-methylhydantoinase A